MFFSAVATMPSCTWTKTLPSAPVEIVLPSGSFMPTVAGTASFAPGNLTVTEPETTEMVASLLVS